MTDKYRGSKEYLLIYAELIRAAHYRGLITYPDVAAIMGLPPTGSHMGSEVGKLIGEISENEVENGRPMLSALVVSITNYRPGPGFYRYARDLGRLSPDEEDERAFWERERDAVYEIWQRN